jgi:cholestenol Delta-isomerase
MLPAFDDPLQRDLFASFVSCTTDATSLYFGANFWARRVLQLSLSEASILYGLCSLSALHRISMVSSSDCDRTTSTLRRYALLQYNQAVKRTQVLLNESSDGSEEKLVKGLVTCILFVCYENFIGNYEISNMHLQNGLQIITKECRKQSGFIIPKDIIQVFKRLDVQAITFGDAKIPYPDTLCKEHIDFLSAPPTSFGCIEDSLDVVLHLCRWMFRREAYSNTCPVSTEDLISANKALECWNLEMDNYLSTPYVRTDLQFQHPVALLKMYQIIMTIIIVTGVQGQEILHDAYSHKYEEVLALAEGLLLKGRASLSAASSNRFFCFDIGVIFPLFWVAIKLRQPQSRRRAVELLSSMRHQEGAWKSSSAAKVARFVIDIEEEKMSKDDCYIPEIARVHLVNTTADVESGEIRVSCVMRSGVDDSTWYTREGRIPGQTERFYA